VQAGRTLNAKPVMAPHPTKALSLLVDPGSAPEMENLDGATCSIHRERALVPCHVGAALCRNNPKGLVFRIVHFGKRWASIRTSKDFRRSTPVSKKKPLFKLKIFRRTEKQPLLNVDSDGHSDLMSAAELPDDARLGKKAGQTLQLEVRYGEGKAAKEFPLSMGDTHGFWESHQDGIGAEFFAKIIKGVKKGEHVTVEVLAVEVLSGSGGKEADVDLD